MSDLFRQFQRGSKEAFEVYYGQYHKHVYHILKKGCGSDAAAKDLSQEVFKDVWAGRVLINDEEQLIRRIFNKARQCLKDHFRDKKAADKAKGDLRRSSETSEKSIEASVMREEVASKLWKAVMRLPRQQQMVATLLFLDGLNVQEVAIKLGVAAQTVRNHKTKALEFLRAELFGLDISFFMFAVVHFLWSIHR